ncbi:hypothetical protein ACOI1H_02360 [Loktanella sp. DJP18]|uniref:hypothetical protein n=1 Tax=Loktanella sp. DJP18 TaxID=3409788 RepID=UPI003BB49FFA
MANWQNQAVLTSEGRQLGECQIEAIRRKHLPHWDNIHLEIGGLAASIQSTIAEAIAFLNSEPYKHIRVFRTEFLAHSIIGPSNDRKRLLNEATEPTTKYLELIQAAKTTASIFDKSILHWEFSTEDSDGIFKIIKSYATMYWKVLPTLRDIEDTRNL